MKTFITILIGVFFIGKLYADATQVLPDRWLNDGDNKTTENYYLSEKEKNVRLSGPWKTYGINHNNAIVQYPWQPDKYNLPSMPLPNDRFCSHVGYMTDHSGSDITLLLGVIRCKGQTTDYDAKRRLKGALTGILMSDRKLLKRNSIDVSNGHGIKGVVKHSSGNITIFLMLSVKDSTYTVSATGSDSSALRSYANKFIESFGVSGHNWKYDTIETR